MKRRTGRTARRASSGVDRPLLEQSATWGMVAVLLGTSVFAVWSSRSTEAASARARNASARSNNYAVAARAVAIEESLERKYRLEPGPDVRAQFDDTSMTLANALAAVRRDDVSQAGLVDQVLALHGTYLDAIRRMFAAVDSDDVGRVLAIDRDEIDPLFGRIEQAVDTAADENHRASVQALDRLRDVEGFVAGAIPLVFITASALVVWFALVLRRVRHQLDDSHDRAVHASMHDALTGLPNRVLLTDRFEQLLLAHHRTGHTTGLLLIDLDRFKDINDTLGHHYGDELLAHLGQRLRTVVRDIDTVARLGGDEFAVLLPNCSGLAEAVSVGNRIREALAAPFSINDVELGVDASIGVVISGEHGTDHSTLLARADIAMYTAKGNGLGVCAYDPSIDVHSLAHLSLVAELRTALERDELTLHYQPKVSLTTGHVTGVEALLRWRHPTRGFIAPHEFIPLAEHTALIGPLTLRVLDIAIAQLRTWLDDGYRIPIAINVSSRNLVDPGLAGQIHERLAQQLVPADLLQLEITETAIMTEPARAREFVAELHDHAIRTAIDDFGVGYTSLGQLKLLPVAELKVDGTFVTTMDTDTANALIVRSIIELGHNLGLTVTAEGVETANVLASLTTQGCDEAQGYHICRPLPADELITWYQHHLHQSDRTAHAANPTR